MPISTAKIFKNKYKKEAAVIFLKAFRKEPHTDMDVVEMSRKGVTKGSLITLGRCFGYSPDKLAKMLPIHLRTVQRYPSSKKFSPTISEHIIQLARIMVTGAEVFGSRELFTRWFETPNRALGGETPSKLVSLQTGLQLVAKELGQIKYGVFV